MAPTDGDIQFRSRAEVTIWDRDMGVLAETTNGRIYFEYWDSFRENELEPSPFYLSTEVDGPYYFDHLLDKKAFDGLPGLFADARPDAYGRRVIRSYFDSRDQYNEQISPVQELLYVGTRAIGALEFHPPENPTIREDERRALDLHEMAKDADRLRRGETDVTIPEMYRIGSSAGGRRPKAIVNFSPGNRTIRSGRVPCKNDEYNALLKFDGANGKTDELGEPGHYNRVEAAYGDMAQDAGITMPDITPIGEGRYYHLVIPRFDIDEAGERLHQHTYGGLQHIDYTNPAEGSYESLFQTMLDLGMDPGDLREAFRRMVFNVCAVNHDDHVKNWSFHMDHSGKWSLTPAYDLTFAHGTGNMAQHQMSINGKRQSIHRDELHSVAEEFGINQPGKEIDRILATIDDWPLYASDHGVPEDAVGRIQGEYERVQQELQASKI